MCEAQGPAAFALGTTKSKEAGKALKYKYVHYKVPNYIEVSFSWLELLLLSD